jgi:hypothetical protein
MKDEELLDSYMNCYGAACIVDIPAARALALIKNPLTPEQTEKLEKSCVEALCLAAKPGSVVRVTCQTGTEVIYVSEILTYLCTITKHYRLDKSKSTSTRLELDNNSAILINFGKV